MDTAAKVKKWAAFLRSVRGFFDKRGFYEVSTPILVPAGAFESSIDCLGVTWNGGRGELHTSPEIEMKAVLSETRLPLYQITKCFRDDPPTGIHRREFTMLEFYRPDVDYWAMLALMKEFLVHLAGSLEIEEVTMAEIFQRAMGINLENCTTAETLRSEAEKKGLLFSAGDDWDTIFYKCLIEVIEPALSPNVPTLIRDYPASQCALGKINESGVTERFEIYWKGMELCNGCTELGDGEVLRRRYKEESRFREAAGKSPAPVPEPLSRGVGVRVSPLRGRSGRVGSTFLLSRRRVSLIQQNDGDQRGQNQDLDETKHRVPIGNKWEKL